MSDRPAPHSSAAGPGGYAVIAITYFALLQITPLWQVADWTSALFRPAYALIVAVLLLKPSRHWAALLLAASALAAASGLLSGASPAQLMAIAVADPVEASLIALLVKRLERNGLRSDELRSTAISAGTFLLAPLLWALALAPLLAYSLELSAVWIGLVRWSSASLSLVLVVPFLQAWFGNANAATPTGLRGAELVTAVVLPTLLLHAAFASSFGQGTVIVLLILSALSLLWGTLREQFRVTASALLIAGAVASWHIAHSSALHGTEAGSHSGAAVTLGLVCIAIAHWVVSTALLRNAREHHRITGQLEFAAHASRRFATDEVPGIARLLQATLKGTAEFIDATCAALYTRQQRSALFRRQHAWSAQNAGLPEAFLDSQLARGGLLPDRDDTGVVAQAPAGGHKGSFPVNVVVTLRNSDGSETALLAGWPPKAAIDALAASDLMRLVLPACNTGINRCREHAMQQQADDVWRHLIAAVPEAFALMKLDGTFVEINPAFEQLTGFSRDELVGTSCQSLGIMDWPMAQPATDTGSGLAAGHLSEPVRLRRKSGEHLHCELHIRQLAIHAESYFAVLAREPKQLTAPAHQPVDLEKQLNQTQRMEAIGQLTQGVAHDFNNILGSILGYASLARMHGPSRNDEKLQDYLSEIEVAGKRATLLIQQMLTFSRRGRTNPVSLNANEVLDRVMDMLPSLLPAGIEARLSVSQGLPLLNVDSAQFEQAVISLAVNARDAITGSGIVTLGSRRFHTREVVCNSCQRPVTGDAIEIYVADTGSGISPEVLDRLFEPFFSTKEVGRGTGLGLSAVHGFVHNHRGHVLISSEPGGGSEFSIVLPVAAGMELEPEVVPSPPEAAGSRRRHILLVEDQQEVASLMKQVLETRQFTVSVFTDSRMAWEQFQREPSAFAAVITDQFMPGLDGVSLASRISSARPEVPVVLCTGAQADVADKAIAAAGISRVFRKPLRVMDFAQEIEEMLATVERK